MTETRTWALLSDGMRARIMRDLETPPAAALVPADLVLRAQSGRLRRMMASKDLSMPDVPPDMSEILRQDLQSFAGDIIAVLDRHRLARDFTRLAIFAPSGLLLAMNAEMPRGLMEAVLMERLPIRRPAAGTGLREAVRLTVLGR